MTFAADLDRDARRALVEGSAELEGIDFVEVLANHPGTPGHVPGAPAQRTLLVHLLNRAVPAGWDRTRVAVRGGVRADPRINPVSVVWAYPAAELAASPPGVTAADRALVAAALPPDPERVFVVRTSSCGDWSTYVLHLLDDAGVPDGFDEPLAQCPFSFTVDCPSDLDCAAPGTTTADPLSAVVPDYLARDYDALRTRLLDRMSVLMPEWTDRSPADPAVMLAELFAYLGDRLAYWQDAVGTEAYLGTAIQRTSVRRHARLLDYRVHEGCSARVWLALTADVPTTLAGRRTGHRQRPVPRTCRSPFTRPGRSCSRPAPTSTCARRATASTCTPGAIPTMCCRPVRAARTWRSRPTSAIPASSRATCCCWSIPPAPERICTSVIPARGSRCDWTGNRSRTSTR